MAAIFRPKYVKIAVFGNVKQCLYVFISTLGMQLLNKSEIKTAMLGQDIVTNVILFKVEPKCGPFLPKFLTKYPNVKLNKSHDVVYFYVRNKSIGNFQLTMAMFGQDIAKNVILLMNGTNCELFWSKFWAIYLYVF